jgi:hypothetical protein
VFFQIDGRSPSLRLTPKAEFTPGNDDISSLYQRRQETQAKNASDNTGASAPLLSMAVSAACLDENPTSPTLFLDAQGQETNAISSNLLLRRRSSKKLLEPQSPSRPCSQNETCASDLAIKQMLSMAVSAAQLNESEPAPIVSLFPAPSANGKGSSLLLRRQSSKKLMQELLTTTSLTDSVDDPATAPILSMAVCAAQLDESGLSPTVSLDAGLATNGRVPSLLLRRQSSKKLMSGSQTQGPPRDVNVAESTTNVESGDQSVESGFPMLSMAVCAAQLDESGPSPTVSLDAGSPSNGKGPSLLLRRQSSKKLATGK